MFLSDERTLTAASGGETSLDADARSVVLIGDQLLLSGPAPEGGRILMGAYTPPNVTAAAVSTLSPAALDGRRAVDTRLADDLPVFAADDHGDLYAAVSGCLLRVLAEGQGLRPASPVQVLWTGDPVGKGVDRPTALTVEASGALLMAAGGRLFRFVVDPGAEAESPSHIRRGSFEHVAGGGSRVPAAGAPALEAYLGPVEGIVQRGDDIWLAHGGFVSRIGSDGLVETIAGGGMLPASSATKPWELMLSPTTGAHASLAVDPSGAIVVADPNQQVLLRFAPGGW